MFYINILIYLSIVSKKKYIVSHICRSTKPINQIKLHDLDLDNNFRGEPAAAAAAGFWRIFTNKVLGAFSISLKRF